MAGQVTDTANALAFAKQKVREAGVDPNDYVSAMTPYAQGWWFRFTRESGVPTGTLDHITVRVTCTGQAELVDSRK